MVCAHVFVCAAGLVAGLALASPAPGQGDVGVLLTRRWRAAADALPERTVPPATPAEVAVVHSADSLEADDLGRKKKIKKTNSTTTVGQEVITAIVDGLSGESEDAAIGSDIRKEFGFLVDAVTKFGAAAITQYAGGGSKPSSSRTAEEADTRSARAVDNVGQGRRRQVRRLLVRYLVLLKVFALGIILPGAVLLSLLQSWKAVTVSLMALLLAGVVGLRGLVTTAAKGQPAEVIHSGPGGHYWRRVSQEPAAEPDRLAYNGYVPVN